MRIALLISLSLSAGTDVGSEWSRFRGPNGTGVGESPGLPIHFDLEQNLVWSTSLATGYSSPVLTGNRIFLTGEKDGALYTYALDRDTGAVLWRREAPRGRRQKLDSRNNPASPTPVTDGEAVFVFFPDHGLLAYSVEGEKLWDVPLGPFNNVYGMGASPILVDDRVILVCDQSTGSFLLAVDKATGEEAWRAARPEAKSGHSTPVVHQPAKGPKQLLVPGSFLLTAYSVETGEKLWWVGGLSFEMKSTPVLDGDVVYVNGYGSPLNQPGRKVEVPDWNDVVWAHDADGDARLAEKEMPDERSRSWFGFVDLNGDAVLDAEDWGYYQAALASTNGVLAISLGGSGDRSEESVRWSYHRAVPQLPSPPALRRRPLPGQRRRHRDGPGSENRRKNEAGPSRRGAGKLLRVASGGRRQDLHDQRGRQGRSPRARRRAVDPGRQRSRRLRLRDARPRRRPHLHPHAR